MKRSIAIPVAALALVAVAAGCGGGTSSGVAGAQKTKASAQVQVRQDWEAFFNASTPTQEKVKLLQNGRRFASLIRSQASSPLARQAKATVSSVSLQGPARAKVVYTILVAGKPALKDQVGLAVRTNGVWQVGDTSFCGLLALQGGTPAACPKG